MWDELLSIPQKELDIEIRERTSNVEWKAQFSPQLVEAHFSRLRNSRCLIADPFAGSGTVLTEAQRLGHDSIGIELNYAPIILGRIYSVSNLSQSAREKIFQRLEKALQPILDNENMISWADGLPDLAAHIEHAQKEDRDLLESIILLSSKRRGRLSRRLKLGLDKLGAIWKDMPTTDNKLEYVKGDARSTGIQSKSVDIIFTSPPYINVLNYHHNYRREIEVLGYGDVLVDAKSEIGANRHYRQNRFRIVVEFGLDMELSLREMSRILKPDGLGVIVIGKESTVLGVTIPNAEIVRRICVEVLGLEVIADRQRKFMNEFGEMIFEDLIYFTNKNIIFASSETKIILRDILSRCIGNCSEKNLPLLKDAISKIDTTTISRLVE